MTRKTKSESTSQQFILPNGLHVICEPDSFAPVVALQLWVKVGGNDETKTEAGLAHVLEHMMFKGTAKRPPGRIAREVEGAGGDINAWTSYSETVYHLALPASELELGVDILSDAVFSSNFDAEELVNELQVIQEEIKRGQDNPQRRLSEEMFRLTFKNHPYRNPVIGTKESVDSFTRAKVLQFYRKWYVPENMTLVLAGDFTLGKAKRLAKKYFGSFEKQNTPKRKSHREPLQKAARSAVIKDRTAQAHIALAFHAPSINEETLPAMEAISVILAQGESSHLIRRLQRKEDVVNDAYAFMYAGSTAGVFIVDAELPPCNVNIYLSRLANEFEQLLEDGITVSELEKAKTILENEAIFQTQSVQGKARKIGFFHTHTGDRFFHERYLKRVRALELSDVLVAAKKYFSNEKANIVLLWPEDEKTPPRAKRLVESFQIKPATNAKRIIKAKPDKNGFISASLDNGLRIILKEHHKTPIVSFQAAWLAGLRFENKNNNGINGMISRMLTLGNETMDAEQLALEVDNMAGQLSGFSGRNTLGLRGQSITRKFEHLMEIFADSILSPRFDEQELAREKALTLEEIKAKMENPGRLAFDLFGRTLYKTHPFKMDILGEEQTVQAFTRNKLMNYHKKMLDPKQMVISVVGDMDWESTLHRLNSLFSGLQSGKTKARPPKPEKPVKTSRKASLHIPKLQTHILLGFLGYTFSDKERIVLNVLNAILAGQGGRLFYELRDKQSLAYAVSSYHLEALDKGYFAVYIATSPDKRDIAVEGILKELARIKDDLKASEVAYAKRYLVGSHAISLQTNASLASQLLFNELYNLGYDYHLSLPKLVKQVTLKEMKDLAAKLFDEGAYVLAEVGPKAEELK